MRKDSRLSRILHALLHLDVAQNPITSEHMGKMLNTNPVVVRRTMSLLKHKGYVSSTKGHHGGWSLTKPLDDITLYDIHILVRDSSIFTIGLTDEHHGCLVEKAVNQTIGDVLSEAEQLVLNRFKETCLEDLAIEFREKVPEYLK